MWFMEEPSPFFVGQTAQSLTSSIMEKPHTGLDDCLNMLLASFRKRMSDCRRRIRMREEEEVRPPVCNLHPELLGLRMSCHPTRSSPGTIAAQVVHSLLLFVQTSTSTRSLFVEETFAEMFVQHLRNDRVIISDPTTVQCVESPHS